MGRTAGASALAGDWVGAFRRRFATMVSASEWDPAPGGFVPAALMTYGQHELTGPHADGVLQDVHWFAGTIGGMFQGYSLGNILAAQFYAQALQAQPTIPSEIAAGHFGTLHDWLRTNIYRHGNKFTTAELVQRVTGQSLSLTPYFDYLQQKYGAIYGVDLT